MLPANSYCREASAKCRNVLILVAVFAVSGCFSEKRWNVEDITGHLPDLSFSLISDQGSPVTATTYKGYILLMYFGFTKCQAECPVSMARLARVTTLLERDADHVRILFVTLDPRNDSPSVLHRYLAQFDPQHAIGLTGTISEIEGLAKRYRTAYRPRSKIGDVSITHGDAIYIFDSRGRARLLATSSASDENLADDVRRLLGAEN